MSLQQELQGFPPAKLAVEDVSKWFRTSRQTVHALSHISLEVAEGEFVCLVGPSGCGKSTLLDIIAGLETPDEGRVIADNEPVITAGRHRLVMFQESALFPWLDVIGNVLFGLKLKPNLTHKDRCDVAKYYLELVGLTKFEEANVHELSGGMKQRVALARALAPDPRVLLMDEPFAALDAQTRDVLHVEPSEIWRAPKKTVVFVTHNVREAVRLGDRVVLMATRPGRIKLDETISLARPRQTESDVAFYVGRIMKELRIEVEKVMREEIDDAWQPAPGAVSGSTTPGVGGGI